MSGSQRDRYIRFVQTGDWAGWDPATDVWPTRGPQAVAWARDTLIHGPGDLLGEPLTFRPDQELWLARWFEFNPHTDVWRFVDALKGEARGGAKTELAAALAMMDLAGPAGIRHRAPDIAVAAVSLENAGQLFSVCQAMAGGRGETGVDCPLKGDFHVHDTEIIPKRGVGRAYRVAAEARGQQGGRPSMVIVDEIHELTGAREEIITVLSDGLLKKLPRGRRVMITTAGAEAGADPAEHRDPIAWRLYLEGLRQRDTPGYRPNWLFDWREASADLDPRDRDDVERGIREASGAADVAWSVDDRADAFMDPTRLQADSMRYFWNRWPTVSGSSWLAETPAAWAKCADRSAVLVDGQQVWVGIDGALRGDTTAVATVGHLGDDRWLWSARVFEAAADGSRGIDWGAVRSHVKALVRRYRVAGIAYDPTLVSQFVGELSADLRVDAVEVPQSVTRRARMDEWARTSIVAGRVVHTGDSRLSSHVTKATWRTSGDARVLGKRASGGKIDALIACVMAHWYATAPVEDAGVAPLVILGAD